MRAVLNWLKSHTLPVQRYIFLLFAVPFALLFSILMVIAEWTASSVASKGAREQFGAVGQRTAESLHRVQEPARAWLGSMVNNPSQGLQTGYEMSGFRVHATMLARFPQISAMYFGYPNGEFARILPLTNALTRTSVKAPTGASFALHIVKTAAGAATEEWRFFNDRLEPVATEQRAHSGYDPRKRPWYKEAATAKLGAIVPTDPYVFANPKQLGVTLSSLLGSTPITSSGAIGGVDFTLNGLSSFLQRQKGGKTLQSLVFDADGNLWAWSKAEQFEAMSQGNVSPTLAALSDPSLRLFKTEGAKWAESADSEYFALKAEEGSDLLASVTKLPGMGKRDVYVAVVQDRDEVFAQVHALRWRMAALGLAGLVIGALIIARLSKRLSDPLRRLAVQTKLLERFRFTEIKHFKSQIREIRTLQEALLVAKTALSGYARYVPKSLVQHQIALRREPRPNVESREVVAMHAVLCGDLHAKRGPNELAFAQFGALSRMIDATRGVVDRVENDGMGAIWNAPLVQSNPSLRAVEAAFQALDSLSRGGAQHPIALHMAIDMGPAGVGNFGGEHSRLIYTAVGAPLDRARALAQEARGLDVSVLVTGPVAEAVKHRFKVERLAAIQLETNETAIELWRVVERLETTEPMEWVTSDSQAPRTSSGRSSLSASELRYVMPSDPNTTRSRGRAPPPSKPDRPGKPTR